MRAGVAGPALLDTVRALWRPVRRSSEELAGLADRIHRHHHGWE
jgi:hypothetical protein